MASLYGISGAAAEAILAAQGGAASGQGAQAAQPAPKKAPADDEAGTIIDEEVAEIFSGYQPCISIGASALLCRRPRCACLPGAHVHGPDGRSPFNKRELHHDFELECIQGSPTRRRLWSLAC